MFEIESAAILYGCYQLIPSGVGRVYTVYWTDLCMTHASVICCECRESGRDRLILRTGAKVQIDSIARTILQEFRKISN